MKSTESPEVGLGSGLENKITIHVVRHGPSSYQIEGFEGPPDKADDLNVLQGKAFDNATEEERQQGRIESIALVREMANNLIDSTAEDEEVVIWSSPSARALQTAVIIKEVLEERGRQVRRKGVSAESGIKVFNRFDEVKNYNHDFYQTLVSGGELDIDGEKVEIDASITNPKSLHETQYFVQNGLDDIPSEIVAKWPEKLAWFVTNMERYESASQRIWGPIKQLSRLNDRKRKIILVTHAGLADILVRSVDPETEEITKPAEFVTLERSDGELRVVRPDLSKESTINPENHE